MTAECESFDLAGLWAEFRETRGRNARNALAEHYLYLAHMVARRFSGKGVDYDDLVQAASLELVRAIERYDSSKGIQFVTFAAPTLAGAVRNYFRDKSRVLRLPRSSAERYVKLRAIRETLSTQLGREPTVSEIAGAMGITEDDALDIIEANRAASTLSLDAPALDTEDGGAASVGSVIGMTEPGYERVEERDSLARALAKLQPDDRKLLTLRIVGEHSQREVASEIGASQMQVSRQERRILDRLRADLLDD
ncbi:hypothetical protein AGMMS49992_05080 [Clostridia bacterium]|nr:hypothetical protein AGMMS49992_05080 [Clostridia bacterium]